MPEEEHFSYGKTKGDGTSLLCVNFFFRNVFLGHGHACMSRRFLPHSPNECFKLSPYINSIDAFIFLLCFTARNSQNPFSNDISKTIL